MKEKGVEVSHAFCSPSLRCVQTAQEILKELYLTHEVPIRIETGLFEWMTWFREVQPTFMTKEEMVDFGVNVDTHYQSAVKVDFCFLCRLFL